MIRKSGNRFSEKIMLHHARRLVQAPSVTGSVSADGYCVEW